MLYLWCIFGIFMLYLCNIRFWDFNYIFSDVDIINYSFIIVFFLYYIKGNVLIKIKWIFNGCLLNFKYDIDIKVLYCIIN